VRIIVDIPAAVFRRSYALIDQGRYWSFGEIITAALETQLTIEETPDDSVVAAARATKGERPNIVRPRNARDVDAQRRMPRNANRETAVASPACVRLPSEVLGPVAYSFAPADMPDLADLNDRKYWLWGVNRVASVKVAARIAVALAAASGGTIPLSRLHNAGGPIACRVGDYLAALDDAAGRKHGYRFSAGIPQSREDEKASAESAARFADLFFGSVRRKTGRVDGALYELRLVAIRGSENGDASVSPTLPGIEFARLHSPILDGDPSPDWTGALSQEEAQWYVQHVNNHVPHEYHTLEQAMGYIRGGHTDANGFLEAMRADRPDLSEKARASLRVCILGRLLDLRLVNRNANGIYSVAGDMA